MPSRSASLVAASILLVASAAPAQTWDAAQDFSLTTVSPGPWYYGWRSIPGGPVLPLTTYGACGGVEGWITADPAMSIAKNTSTQTACCYTWALPAGKLLWHPGTSGQSPVLRFTAPAAGQYQIQIACPGVDYSGPTTTRIDVEEDGAPLYAGFVSSYGGPVTCQGTQWSPTATYSAVRSLNQGSTIDAILSANGGWSYDATGLAMTVTRIVQPSVAQLGAGCGIGAAAPVLACTTPQLGQLVTLSISNAVPGSGGMLYFGAPGTPIPIGNGCTVYLDPATLSPFLTFQADGTGTWSFSLILPNNPVLAGVEVSLQAQVISFGIPPFAGLTNGIRVTFG